MRLYGLGMVCVSGVILAAGASGQANDVSSNWFRSPAVSPDGQTVIFTHAGDLYEVPITGGRAIPLTIGESHDTMPVWSPDGSMIAYASDRFGNYDVFVMPAGGGESTRLTYHSSSDMPSDFTHDGEMVVFTSSRIDDDEASLFPSGVLSELYAVSVEGGTPEMLLTTPAVNASIQSDGSILYEDVKGYEDPLRKHHRSSIARDIWYYNARTGEHTQVTTFEGEDREPVFEPGGRTMLFLSERNGDQNIYRASTQWNNDAEQLTSFEHHPVRDLSVAEENGVAVFSWHGDLYRMEPNGEPEMIDVRITVTGRESGQLIESRGGGASDFAVSPSGKEVAFVVRGEVFVTSTDFRTTKRITTTAEQERSVDFAPDGRSIIYAGERDGSWNIYRASLKDDDELYFFSATKIEEEPLIATGAEEFQPRFSPDGEKIAYLHNRHAIRVFDLESEESVEVLPAKYFYSYSDGDHWFDWSPDSRWLAVHFYNRDRMFAEETGLVSVENPGDEPIDISNSGYADGQPRWAMEGGAIIWGTDRYGEKNHGSWGGEYDVVAAFLTQDSYDKFRLTKEEYELQKELEEKRKEDEKKKKDDEDEDADDAAAASDDDSDSDEAADTEDGSDEDADEEGGDEEEEVEPIEIELDGIEDRTVRLTVHASDLADFAMSDDGKKLFYLARFEDGYDLWVQDFLERETKMLVKLGAGSASMQMSDDGKSIFMLAGGSLSKVDADSGKREGISFSADLDIDRAQEQRYLFDHIHRQVEQKFYRADLHGVDWDFYYDQYEPKLAGIHHGRDFAEMLSELLGELNASHTGGRYRPGGDEGDSRTASIGAFLEPADDGHGMVIAEIMTGGPLDKADIEVEEGMVLTHIDGEEITAQTNIWQMLDRSSGDRVRLTFEPADGSEAFDEVIKPISRGAENQLLYDRWVAQRRELVDELSGGRLGYVHIRGMNDASFRVVYAEVLGRMFDKEGLVVDTRFNGGGWLHDDLVTFLTGKNYVNMYPRQDDAPERTYYGEPGRRWSKPSIVVMSESNYSDAHFFPWAYRENEIGKLVGMPVPGTSTAVWWERLHTGDVIFGIPQLGTKGVNGEYLENSQLEPDYEVKLDPESAAAGRDPQIARAVEVLLQEIDE